jgi:hypothetical protein
VDFCGWSVLDDEKLDMLPLKKSPIVGLRFIDDGCTPPQYFFNLCIHIEAYITRSIASQIITKVIRKINMKVINGWCSVVREYNCPI